MTTAEAPENAIASYVNGKVAEFMRRGSKNKARRLDQGEIETFVEEACRELKPEELVGLAKSRGIPRKPGWESALTFALTNEYIEGNPSALMSLREMAGV
jgi:hypothetical protein